MRQQFTDIAEHGRIIIGPHKSNPGDRFGQFLISGPRDLYLQVIANSAETVLKIAKEDELDPLRFAWDHVSVCAIISRRKKIPTWDQMCFIKDQFWDEDECVLQFHPPKKNHVNIHDKVLHLWKWYYSCGGQAMPPIEMV